MDKTNEKVIYKKSELIADDGTSYRTSGTLSIIKSNNLVFLEWKAHFPLKITSFNDGWEIIDVVNEIDTDRILLSNVDMLHYNLSKLSINSSHSQWHIFTFPCCDVVLFVHKLRGYVSLEKISVNNYKVTTVAPSEQPDFKELSSSYEGSADTRTFLAPILSGIFSFASQTIMKSAVKVITEEDHIDRPNEVSCPELAERPFITRENRLTIEDFDKMYKATVSTRAFYGGLDNTLRPRVWTIWLGFYEWDSGVDDRERRYREKREEYMVMKTQWKTMTEDQWRRNKIMKENLSMIDKDVHRTDRDTEYFSKEDNLCTLKEILITYCCYDSDLGYIQGMNDILAMILITIQDEIIAFWCFCNLMERVHSNFEPELPGIRRQLLEFASLLENVIPDVYKHLVGQGISEILFCLRWFIVFFKREFSISDSFLIWDAILSEHVANFHYLIGLALLDNCRSSIVKANDIADIIDIINNVGSSAKVEDILCTAVSIGVQIGRSDCISDVLKDFVKMNY